MLTRRSFLMAAPASACALAACTTTVTSVPTPAKNYDIDLIERAPPTLKVSPRCHPCEAFGSLYIEEETLRSSDHAPIARWREQVLALSGRTRLEQLEGVNQAVNADIRYRSDYAHWNVRDKWGFPVEALEEGGDCEDFAVLKLESLRFLGWREEAFYLLVGVSDLSGKKEGHAVLLAVLDDGSQLILDSATDWMTPPRDDHHFFPVYAVNRSGYYHVRV